MPEKGWVTHSASYLGATPPCHLTTPQERYIVAPRDTQNIFLGGQVWVAPHTNPFWEWFTLLGGFWGNQRLRDDHHRAILFFCRP